VKTQMNADVAQMNADTALEMRSCQIQAGFCVHLRFQSLSLE